MSDTPLQTHVNRLRTMVRTFGAFRKRWHLLDGLGRFVVIGPGALLGWFLLDWALGLPAWLLFALFCAAAGASLVAFAWLIGRRLLLSTPEEDEALVIEGLHGSLDNALIGSLQLGQQALRSDGRAVPHASALVAVLVRDTLQRIEAMDLRALVDRGAAKRYLQMACCLLALMLVLTLSAPDAVVARGARLAAAWDTVLETLFPISFEVQPGDRAVLRNTPVNLRVTVRGARRNEARLEIRPLDKKEKAAAAPRSILLALQDEQAAHALSVEHDFAYRFRYRGKVSPEYVIRAGDRPALEAIQYEFVYPPYTGQPLRTLTGLLEKVQGLVGTRVSVSFAANTDLHVDSCYVRWRDGTTQPVSVTGRFGHFAFTVGRADRAELFLTGVHGPGFEMKKPVRFAVAVQADVRPSVQIRLKDEAALQMEAGQAPRFGLPWEASDDFGVAEVTLQCKIESIDPFLGSGSREHTLTRRIDPAQTRTRGVFQNVFESLDPPLAAGDKAVLTLTARDNNIETGPGLGRSRSVTVEIVAEGLGGFREDTPPGFGGMNLLVGVESVHRVTDLLVKPKKSNRRETKQTIRKSRVDSQVDAGGAGDSAAADDAAAYFNLLRGEP